MLSYALFKQTDLCYPKTATTMKRRIATPTVTIIQALESANCKICLKKSYPTVLNSSS